ncbi:outer membrane beta-barrel protein [Alkaliflexus imshenetskii]|uniref:outer membrane beta-barrel protein n=1 Tax=Alkaliflexus imshenetskii TaxID=286730 RepID=UPI001C54D52E|nr:outer membrane beta-barrel protein [Alkaliflexus imshenetskii]
MIMKKVLFLFVAILAIGSLQAQETGKFRVGVDLGYTIPSDGGGGVMFNFEPKYNIADNMNVGLRISSAAMAKGISSSDGSDMETKISANGSYMGTFDYYFSKGTSSFAPYVGGGLGYVSLASVELESSSTSADGGLDVSGKLGGLIRAGFEAGKFRMGLEYNLIPKSKIDLISGGKGEIANSYLGIHMGFYVGGGKWKK